MVTPGAPVRLHRISNDQLYHYYLGEPLEVFMLHPTAARSESSSDQTYEVAKMCNS